MAHKCAVCGKGTRSGNQVSHSHRATKRKFRPNLQKVRARSNNGSKKVWICGKCIKSGKLYKPTF